MSDEVRGCCGCLVLPIGLAFWVAVAYVVVHFVLKYW